MYPMTDFWTAPPARRPIDGSQVVPGSKSITNRAFVLAAVASSPSTITGALVSRDTELMAGALRSLGAQVRIDGPVVTVSPPERFTAGFIDCGLAGTVMRFVPPVAALADGDVLFDGDPQARLRPMGAILDGLRAAGVEVTGDSLPFTVHGRGIPAGGVVEVDASGSSQFVSGLLLSASRFRDGLTVRHIGASLPSAPHIAMTVDMLRAAGATVTTGDGEWSVAPGALPGRDWIIEPDLSNATPFLAAAAVTGGSMRIPHWPETTTQPGDEIREILLDMGCEVSLVDDTLHVTGPGELRGITRDMASAGELVPTVAALAALATTESRLTGIAHLRGHETDRLAALTTEINRLGGDCEELADGLLIRPATLHGGQWHSYADHRVATAGAIIGLVTEGVEVEDIDTTAKTLPGFAGMWTDMIHG